MPYTLIWCILYNSIIIVYVPCNDLFDLSQLHIIIVCKSNGALSIVLYVHMVYTRMSEGRIIHSDIYGFTFVEEKALL